MLDIARANFKSAHEDSDLLLTAADAQRLVSACPNLQSLSAYGTLLGADAVAALRPLSGLRTLLLGNQGLHWVKLRNAAGVDWAQALAQLTTLVELDVAPERTETAKGVVQGVSQADLLQLTTLRRLTRLEIWHDIYESMAWYHKVREGVGTLSNQGHALLLPDFLPAQVCFETGEKKPRLKARACSCYVAVQVPEDAPVWQQLLSGAAQLHTNFAAAPATGLM